MAMKAVTSECDVHYSDINFDVCMYVRLYVCTRMCTLLLMCVSLWCVALLGMGE